jgi:hypothetical protein
MVVLKMRRPTSSTSSLAVRFVRLCFIDSSWHPFHRVRTRLAFYRIYIEVFDEQSWTGKLWQLINDNRAEEGRTGSALRIDIDLMGPVRHGPQEGRFQSCLAVELVQVHPAMRKQVCVSLRLVRYQLTRPLYYTLHCRNRAHAKLA